MYPAVLNKAKQSTIQESSQFIQEHVVKPSLQPGTKVMIKQVDKQPGDTEYAGPYTVSRLNKGGAYILTDATGRQFPHKVPRKLIKVIDPPRTTSQNNFPEPSTAEYEVERILAH
jgi:hypothetical protein